MSAASRLDTPNTISPAEVEEKVRSAARDATRRRGARQVARREGPEQRLRRDKAAGREAQRDQADQRAMRESRSTDAEAREYQQRDRPAPVPAGTVGTTRHVPRHGQCTQPRQRGNEAHAQADRGTEQSGHLLRQIEDHPVDAHLDQQIDRREQQHPAIQQRGENMMRPMRGCGARIVVERGAQGAALLRVEPTRIFGAIVEIPERPYADHGSQCPLDQKQPLPAGQTQHAMQVEQ
ncbi:hypothetical protein KCU90_g3775, partial [Aureobasidium melanogenum]